MCHGRVAAHCAPFPPLVLPQFLHICSTKRPKWNAQKISWQDKAEPKNKRSQIGQCTPPSVPATSVSPEPRRRKANRKREIAWAIWTYGHMDRSRLRRRRWLSPPYCWLTSSLCLWVAAGGGPFAYWNDRADWTWTTILWTRQLCVRQRPNTTKHNTTGSSDTKTNKKSEICFSWGFPVEVAKMSCGFMTSLATTGQEFNGRSIGSIRGCQLVSQTNLRHIFVHFQRAWWAAKTKA